MRRIFRKRLALALAVVVLAAGGVQVVVALDIRRLGPGRRAESDRRELPPGLGGGGRRLRRVPRRQRHRLHRQPAGWCDGRPLRQRLLCRRHDAHPTTPEAVVYGADVELSAPGWSRSSTSSSRKPGTRSTCRRQSCSGSRSCRSRPEPVRDPGLLPASHLDLEGQPERHVPDVEPARALLSRAQGGGDERWSPPLARSFMIAVTSGTPTECCRRRRADDDRDLPRSPSSISRGSPVYALPLT